MREELIEKLPSALCLTEVVFNERGVPVDYKLTAANPAFERLFQPTKKRAFGKSIACSLFKTQALRSFWFEAFAKLVAKNGRGEFEEVLEIDQRWYLLTAFVPYQNHLVILLHETAGYQKTHAALEKVRAEFQLSLSTGRAFSQSIFENSPSSIIIYEVLRGGETSLDYIIRGVNRAALAVENWREEEVLGRPLGELRPGAEEFGIIDVFRRVWQTGEVGHHPATVYREGEEYRWFENIVFKLPTDEIVAIYNDVTARMLVQEELFLEKEKLSVTLYSIGDAVITTDTAGKVEILNPVAEQLTGWTQEQAEGRPLHAVFNIFNEQTGQPAENPVQKVLETGKIVGLANHTILKAKNGREYAISDSAAPITKPGGEIIGVVLVFQDVTEARKKQAAIEYLSFRDSLTGLFNRAFLEEEFERLDDPKHFPLSIIMGDLDGLKLINDAFGHQVGDRVLVKIAAILKRSARQTDLVGRWGGDEFLILLPQTPMVEALKICQQIKESVAGAKIAETELGISLGCAAKIDPLEKRQETLRRAEDNMYKAKLLEAKSYRNVVLTSIKNTLFEKSLETEEHGERLGRHCRAIGEILGLSSLQLAELQVFSMLHDIGKIGIDEQILQKPGPLTEEEWKIIKTHPEIGYRIAGTVPELVNIADYILTHHERWDGKGYPRGLAKEEIPLLARILAVVDAFDAMTHDRIYRQALTKDAAKEELRRNAGTQFDPEIVEIFLNYLEKEEQKRLA